MNRRMKVQVETDSRGRTHGNAFPESDGARSFRRKLFDASAFALALSLAVYVLASPSNDWAIVASIGIGLIACGLLALALAV